MFQQLQSGEPAAHCAEAVSGPAFSTCAGLLGIGADTVANAPTRAYRPREEPNGRLSRLGQWLREYF